MDNGMSAGPIRDLYTANSILDISVANQGILQTFGDSSTRYRVAQPLSMLSLPTEP